MVSSANGALVRPSFPTPPAGTSGILLFPYTASSQTLTGGTAVANGEWNNAPANFFNDFTSCAGGKASDCYRSETFPDPLLPGEASAAQTVGFDVPKAAQSASTFVVVAADLGRQVTLAGTSTRCGTIGHRSTTSGGDDYFVNAPAALGAGSQGGDNGSDFKGFCGFALGGLPRPDLGRVRWAGGPEPSAASRGVRAVAQHETAAESRDLSRKLYWPYKANAQRAMRDGDRRQDDYQRLERDGLDWNTTMLPEIKEGFTHETREPPPSARHWRCLAAWTDTLV